MINEFRAEFTEMVKLLKNDHIYLKHGYIRGLSPLWWIVRLGQGALAVGCCYMFYCAILLMA